jgi:hypothetical protein
VTEAEVEDLLRGPTAGFQHLPTIRRERLRRIPRRGDTPEVLATVRVPDVEHDVGPPRNHHAAPVGGLDPGVDGRAARQEIERGREAERLFEHAVERPRLREIVGVVDVDLPHLVIESLLD